MATVKISELSPATLPLSGTELVPLVQGGVTKQTAATNIKNTGVLPVVNGGTGTATPSLIAGTNVSITGTWPNQTINSSGGGGGGMVYPGAGIPLSTGIAWGTSYSTTGSGTNIVLGTSPTIATPVITGTISGSSATGALSYGTLSYSDTNLFGTFQTSVNSYAQTVLQNTNSGATASTDYVVNNNSSTATTFYGNFGMNSSGFTGTGSFNQPNYVYLTSTSSDLAIGTTTANGIRFVVNGGTTDSFGIDSGGRWLIGGSAGTSGQVFTSQGAGAAPIWQTAAGGGNVSNSGTPTSGQIAEWTSATVIQGVASNGTGNVVRTTSAALVTPALGTPTAGVLTSCTGLPMTTGVTGILAGTNGGTGVNNSTRLLTYAGNVTFTGAFNVSFTVPAANTYTLPASTDTLVARTSTDTLTNKRITLRTGTTASSATPTINTDNVDYYSITALAAAITSFTTNLTGTPADGDGLIITITDNGTARAITWGAKFEASTVALPTTTVISTKLTVGFLWNTTTSAWRCVGVA